MRWKLDVDFWRSSNSGECSCDELDGLCVTLQRAKLGRSGKQLTASEDVVGFSCGDIWCINFADDDQVLVAGQEVGVVELLQGTRKPGKEQADERQDQKKGI